MKRMNTKETFNIVESEMMFQKDYGNWDPINKNKTIGDHLILLDDSIRKAKETWVRIPGCSNALEDVRRIAAQAILCLQDHGTSGLGWYHYGMVDPDLGYHLFGDTEDQVE